MAKRLTPDDPHVAQDDLEFALNEALVDLRSFYDDDTGKKKKKSDEALLDDLFARYQRVWTARRRLIRRDLEQVDRKIGLQ